MHAQAWVLIPVLGICSGFGLKPLFSPAGGAPDNRDALHIPSHADTIVGNCMEIYNSMLIKKQLHGREHVLCDFIALPYPLWSNSQVLSCAIWEHGPVHVTL